MSLTRNLPSDHQQMVLDSCEQHGIIRRILDTYRPTLEAMERRGWVQLLRAPVPDGRGGFHNDIVGGLITIDGQTARIRGRQWRDQQARNEQTRHGGAATTLADPFAAHHPANDTLPF